MKTFLLLSLLFIAATASQNDTVSLTMTDLLDIVKGRTVQLGERGKPGPPGPKSGGTIYVRWGNHECPTVNDTEIVYSGIAARGYYDHTGGGINYQCFPEDPDYYEDHRAGVQSYGLAYGVEYEVPVPELGEVPLQDQGVPCAVCLATTREVTLMIPAKLSCPTGWTKEYHGFLMSAHHGHKSPSTFECIDYNAGVVPGTEGNRNGGLFYHVEATCTGLPCDPYDPQKELSCIVCTK